MTIASAITSAQGRVADCYTAISGMGGTLPATQNLTNMPTAINSIPTGGSGGVSEILIPNYTAVGSVSVDSNYIASGFSNSNYIKMGTFDPGSSSWEVATKIHTASSISGYMWMFKSLNADKLALCIYNSNPDVNVGNGSTWYNGQVWTDTTISPNTDYWYKMTFNGSNKYSVLRSTDGINYTEIAYINETRLMASNTLVFGWKQSSPSGSFIQSIDLKETYVKIAGETFWEAIEKLTAYETPVNIGGNTVYLSGIPKEKYVYDANFTRYGYPQTSFSFSFPRGVNSIDSYALQYAFSRCTTLTSIDLSKIKQFRDYCMFHALEYCTGLTSIDLSSVVSVTTYGLFYAFYHCENLTGNISMNSISSGGLGTYALSSAFAYTGITGFSCSVVTAPLSCFTYAFRDCTSLTSVSFSSLQTANATAFQNAWRGCTSLTTISFPALKTMSAANVFQNAFYGCTSLTSVSFPALTSTSFGTVTSQFNNMLSGVTGCTVHFPSNLQSVIGSWTDVTNGFGGTNTTVSFDLTATT